MPATTTFADKPTLLGAKVLLRPVRPEEDLPMLRVMLNDPDVLRYTSDAYTPVAPAWDEAMERRITDWYTTRNDQPDRLDLIVVDRATGRGVGEVVLNEWDEPNRACNLRIALGPDGRDRGLGTEAVRLLTDHALRALGLNRVSLSVYAFNERGRRAYEKAGFQVEGVRRQVLRWGDEWIDDIDMAALADHWT
ncbi:MULTISPECIES: GNAT family protein [Kitasatospora]|uniref:Putative acetyltransferase n=1 Tax=Kitasatospora setae (strain ATCC 33774 / DSM 43861 / JCM 3304 / KCC A-0304 / NBRC 14216 / KM-6054) TaxID=452652 RepID=E4N9G6_KITSK|nr:MULTISPECIES: GNAT family protein [Kitasatospora]BAJ27847.1 putative acetyltransferase [Kitasatospora setae KM-6054]